MREEVGSHPEWHRYGGSAACPWCWLNLPSSRSPMSRAAKICAVCDQGGWPQVFQAGHPSCGCFWRCFQLSGEWGCLWGWEIHALPSCYICTVSWALHFCLVSWCFTCKSFLLFGKAGVVMEIFLLFLRSGVFVYNRDFLADLLLKKTEILDPIQRRS